MSTQKVWTVIETKVTPQLLRAWAFRLHHQMTVATLGDEVPFIEVKDYESNSIIMLRANQEAWHNKDKGKWL